MLVHIVNIVKNENLAEGPFYIVGEVYDSDETISYIKTIAIRCHPSFPDDEVLEQTPDIWEAQLFSRLNDAMIVLKERCGFGCNCGACNKTGKVWEVTRSNRTKENVTYGYCDCLRPGYHKDFFETVYNVKEIASHVQK
jgi:hypothetical protein